LAHTIKSIEIVAMLFDNDSLLKLSIATFLDNDKWNETVATLFSNEDYELVYLERNN